MLQPSICLWYMNLFFWCATTTESLGTLPIFFLKESSQWAPSDRIYIRYSHHMRHLWLCEWITLSQSKTLANQGPGGATKKSCSGELATERLEDRESQSDLMVSQKAALMFYIRMSSIWVVGGFILSWNEISCKYNSGFNFPSHEWATAVIAACTDGHLQFKMPSGGKKNQWPQIFPYVVLVMITRLKLFPACIYGVLIMIKHDIFAVSPHESCVKSVFLGKTLQRIFTKCSRRDLLDITTFCWFARLHDFIRNVTWIKQSREAFLAACWQRSFRWSSLSSNYYQSESTE